MRESWQTKESKDERKAFRRRFKDLSRVEARALAAQQHPSVFLPRVWSPLRGVKRRGEFLDAYSARVTLPNGTDAVAVSSLPLRTRSDDGGLGAVDLDLVARGDALGPENPLVDTIIPARSSDTVRVGEIGFELGGDVPVQLENNRAFYADAGGQDIDLMVMPTPSGVESFAQIRSVDAAEEVRMAFDLPPGTELRRAPGEMDGPLEIVRGGEVIATVTRPAAVDAQQRPVPVEYRVEGDDLVMGVAHRSGDFAMPIMLDPNVVYGWDHNPRRLDSTGWGVYQSNPGSRWCSFFGDSYQGYGQYTYGRGGGYPCSSTSYSPYEVYEFNYYGEYWRGSSAFVEGWDEGYNNDVGSGGTCHYSGIYSIGLGRWETFSGNECATGWNRIRYHRSPGTPPNYAVFGTVINGSGLRHNFTNQLWGTTLFVSDRDNPTVEQGPRRIPDGWTKDTTFDITARDRGIGVYWTQLRLSGPDVPDDHYEFQEHPCSADPINHCPPSRTFQFTTDQMPEGTHTVSAQAYDLIRVPPLNPLGTIKLDRTGPEIGNDRITGPLKANEGKGLYDPTYGLTVTPRDGLNANERSGVQRAELLVDNVVKDTATASACTPTQCPHNPTLNLTLRTDEVQDGQRTIAVRTTDLAGNPTTSNSWQVIVDRRGDIYRAEQSSWVAGAPAGVAAAETEWGRRGTSSARRLEGRFLSTRDTVQRDGAWADEVRVRSRRSDYRNPLTNEQAAHPEALRTHRGDGTNDPNLEIVADILRPARDFVGRLPVRRNIPPAEVLVAGQGPPPARGPDYSLYEETQQTDDGPVSVKTFVDPVTMMPVLEQAFEQDGSMISGRRWSYDPSRLTLAEVPADFFRLARPADVGWEKSYEAQGAGPVGMTTDDSTQSQFRAYHVGHLPILSGAPLVFTGSEIIRQRLTLAPAVVPQPHLEPGDQSAAGGDTPATYVQAYYAPRPAGVVGYVPNALHDGTPLWIRTMATSAADANAWRSEYQGHAEAVQADPTHPDFGRTGPMQVTVGLTQTTAWAVSTGAGTTSSLLELGGSTIIIEGEYTRPELAILASRLEAF